MANIFKYLCGASGVLGFFLIYIALSASDYCAIELGQTEPQFVWNTLIAGIVLLIPAVIRMIYLAVMEREENVPPYIR